MAVKRQISIRKAEVMEQSVINCEDDQKKLFSLIHSLFGSKKITVLPAYTSSFTLASSINMFFIEKIHNIKLEFPLLGSCLPAYSFVDTTFDKVDHGIVLHKLRDLGITGNLGVLFHQFLSDRTQFVDCLVELARTVQF